MHIISSNAWKTPKIFGILLLTLPFVLGAVEPEIDQDQVELEASWEDSKMECSSHSDKNVGQAVQGISRGEVAELLSCATSLCSGAFQTPSSSSTSSSAPPSSSSSTSSSSSPPPSASSPPPASPFPSRASPERALTPGPIARPIVSLFCKCCITVTSSPTCLRVGYTRIADKAMSTLQISPTQTITFDSSTALLDNISS